MNMDEKVYVWRIKHMIAKNWGGRLSTPIKEMLSKLLDTIYIVIWSLNIHFVTTLPIPLIRKLLVKLSLPRKEMLLYPRLRDFYFL